jgi:trans-aconitate methyltransferase
MNVAAAVSSGAFEARYAGGRDPWSFAKDPYELGRYATILASLQRPAYRTVYEPGCAVGILTRQLSRLAEQVIATDFAPSAIAQARERCTECANVQFICSDLRSFNPRQPLDLIVFSEVGYYFSEGALSALTVKLAQTLAPGGEFIAAHWLGTSPDHILHGNRVHAILRAGLSCRAARTEVHARFRLESWVKP